MKQPMSQSKSRYALPASLIDEFEVYKRLSKCGVFQALQSEHTHQFVIPVEWAECEVHKELKEGGKKINDYFLDGYEVTILRCACGEETTR